MNNTARMQASFSLPEVLLEDKIERMGKNQTKMIIPKREERSRVPYPEFMLYKVSGMVS